MTIRRRKVGRDGHAYTVDGVAMPGVTTILGAALPKPALIDWAGRTTAGYAVDHWEELAEQSVSQRLETLNRARFEERDAAARRGTEVHRLAERLVAGLEVDVPEAIAGHVDAYVDFLNTLDPAPILVEAVVANRSVGYCGTLDLVCDIKREPFVGRWLVDLKTTRSGIYGETALQNCAYGRAEVYVDANGAEVPFADLGPLRHGALWIRADAWELRELQHGDDVWAFFRYLAWVARHVDDVAGWVGPAIDVREVVS